MKININLIGVDRFLNKSESKNKIRSKVIIILSKRVTFFSIVSNLKEL